MDTYNGELGKWRQLAVGEYIETGDRLTCYYPPIKDAPFVLSESTVTANKTEDHVINIGYIYYRFEPFRIEIDERRLDETL